MISICKKTCKHGYSTAQDIAYILCYMSPVEAFAIAIKYFDRQKSVLDRLIIMVFHAGLPLATGDQ